MSNLSKAIETMRDMRESYDQIGAAAEAYNTGKEALAENITAKGVDASASETLPELAEKVSAISQESYTIEGGEMYAKQQFANGLLWDLYDILYSLLSSGSYVEFGGIILAEYHKGYATIELSGADCYLTCDGAFYNGAVVHTWQDLDNGKADRWVAYFFRSENATYTIPGTNVCPRSIYIGRKVGAIVCNVPGRISNIIVPDGNTLGDIRFTAAQNYGEKLIIRNNGEHITSWVSIGNSNFVTLELGFKRITTYLFSSSSSSQSVPTFANLAALSFPDLEEIVWWNSDRNNWMRGMFGLKLDSAANLACLNFPKLRYMENVGNGLSGMSFIYLNSASKFKSLEFPSLEIINRGYFLSEAQAVSAVRRLGIPRLKRLDNFSEGVLTFSYSIYDIEVGAMETNLPLNYWYPQENTGYSSLTEIPEAIREEVLYNIYRHIALKVSDRTGLSTLTISFSAEVKNSIRAEESQRIVNTLMDKNWQIA